MKSDQNWRSLRRTTKSFSVRPKARRGVDDERDELDVGLEAGFADDVAVELVVFAAAAFLGALVAVDLGDGEPLERLLEILVAGGDEAGERGGHFGAERDVAVALVLEVVELVGDFIAGLFGEEVEGLEGGGHRTRRSRSGGRRRAISRRWRCGMRSRRDRSREIQ